MEKQKTTRTISYNELRLIKDSLPAGSMRRIADELGMEVEAVRSYFGGGNENDVSAVGFHLEPGPDGGIVRLDDERVLDKAWEILRGEI